MSQNRSFQKLWLLLAAWALPALGAEIFRCQVEGAPPVYSQFPCAAADALRRPERYLSEAQPVPPPGVRPKAHRPKPSPVQQRLLLGPPEVIQMPSLTPGERNRLAEAEHRSAARRKRTLAARRRDQQALRKVDAQQAARCHKARQQLKALGARRRKGYTLKDARGLTEQERALNDVIGSNC